MTLLALPKELQWAIVSKLGSIEGLQALASTCVRLHDVCRTATSSVLHHVLYNSYESAAYPVVVAIRARQMGEWDEDQVDPENQERQYPGSHQLYKAIIAQPFSFTAATQRFTLQYWEVVAVHRFMQIRFWCNPSTETKLRSTTLKPYTIAKVVWGLAFKVDTIDEGKWRDCRAGFDLCLGSANIGGKKNRSFLEGLGSYYGQSAVAEALKSYHLTTPES